MSNTRSTGNNSRGLQQLGGLCADEFLRRHWQKKPLLIRNAFPAFRDPLTKGEVFTLAARDEAESRMVAREGGQWTLRHGPFSRKELTAKRAEPWTVLVQDTQHFSYEAHELLAAFRFIPHARIDDLMVSYASPGAGVGPHYDSYDVFLIQGSGRRRWRISAQADLRLQPGLPLKILAKFRPEQEYLLEKGDALYLPPGYAHDGIAEGDCLTWSVGFRAPTQQELATAYLDYLRDHVSLTGTYRDPDLTATEHAGQMDSTLLNRFSAMLDAVQVACGDRMLRSTFLGHYLTEPKSHVFFDAPEPALGSAKFCTAIRRLGVELDLKTRFLYQRDKFFINGTAFDVGKPDAALFRKLADLRMLDADEIARSSKTALGPLLRAYQNGYLHVRDEVFQEN
jgi:50S ribosomal protein L16 3-hydroxylase